MKRLLLIILFIILLQGDVNAQETDYNAELMQITDTLCDELGISAFEDYRSDSFAELFGEQSVYDLLRSFISGERTISLSEVFAAAANMMLMQLREISRLLSELLALCVISALLASLAGSFLGNEVRAAIKAAVCACGCLLLARVFFTALEWFSQGAGELVSFMQVCASLLVVLLATGGAGSTAGLLTPSLVVCANILSYLFTSVIIPAAQFAFVLGIADKLLSSVNLKPLYKLVRRAASLLLGASLTLCTGLISLQAGTFAKLDGVGVKGLKYAISNLIPVVGSFLSSSLEAVAGYLNLIRASVGLVGALVVCALIAAPVLKSLAMCLALKLTAALAAPFAEESLSDLMDMTADSLIFVLGCLFASGVMCIIVIAGLSRLSVPLGM